MNPGLSLSYYSIWRSVQPRSKGDREGGTSEMKEGKSVFEAKKEKQKQKQKRKGKKKVLKRKE